MLSLHGCDLAIPAVLYQKVLQILLQHSLYHMLQSRVLHRQPKHLLQTFLNLCLDEADLFIHDVQSRIVWHLLEISVRSFLFLSSLIKRHYSVTLPQFFYLFEEEVDFCKLLL